MIRMHVNLDEHEYALVKREARKVGVSVTEFIRTSIRQSLSADDTKPWMRYAGLVDTGDRDSSQSIDEVVYGSQD